MQTRTATHPAHFFNEATRTDPSMASQADRVSQHGSSAGSISIALSSGALELASSSAEEVHSGYLIKSPAKADHQDADVPTGMLHPWTRRFFRLKSGEPQVRCPQYHGGCVRVPPAPILCLGAFS